MIFFHAASAIFVPTSPQKAHFNSSVTEYKVWMLQSARGLPLVRLFRSRRQLYRSVHFILELFLCANGLLRPMGGSQGIIWMRDQAVLDGNLDVIWLVTVNGISWLAFWLKAETLVGQAHVVCSTCSAGRKLRNHRCLLDYHPSNQYVFVNAADILAQILGEHAVFPQYSLPHPATKFSILRHANYDDSCVAKEDQIPQEFRLIIQILSEPRVVYMF